MVVFVLLELLERGTVEPCRIDDQLSELGKPSGPLFLGHLGSLDDQRWDGGRSPHVPKDIGRRGHSSEAGVAHSSEASVEGWGVTTPVTTSTPSSLSRTNHAISTIWTP